MRPCARARACAIGRPRIRADTCERLPAGVDRVRPRRAGVQLGVGVQREHRRMEHRLCVEHGLCMRRLIGRGRRATAGGRVLGTAARRNAGMYVQTYIYTHILLLYMYMYMYVYIYVCVYV